ncbi:hypothetical protein [Agromyces atrinae]|uniref:ABC transporter ATP-binding protein n=1 Tax=Agromyces atrinae TaxID=592376 RepID=A0A4Q2M683_9MICO|nr:hypothetical protein [Agromyces atrinae]NYD68164.1 hypothetical protein [Agromyces atrinae]RXZ87694.1 hypothetical protein ESP50_00350 [Agromyces atrinae]
MQVELAGVTKGARGAPLPLTNLRFESGRATLTRAETERRPTVLGLIASGRMRPTTGSVTIDGVVDHSKLRARVALIDAPSVSDPAPDITVAGVAAEELMFAGIPSNPRRVARTLAELGLTDVARSSIADVDAVQRLTLLCELAIRRPGVEGLVIVSPDRHGGDPVEWWRLANGFADRGLAVLMIAGDASAAAIAASSMLDRMRGSGDDELELSEGGLA